MNISDIAQDARRIVWRYKFLWLLGLFAAFTVGGVSYVPSLLTGNLGGLSQAWATGDYGFILIFIVGLLLGLALVVVSLVTQAGLITAAQQVLHGKHPKLSDSIRDAIKFFRPLSLIALMLLGSMGVLVLGFIPGTQLTESYIIFVPLFFIFWLANFVALILHQFAQRAVILDSLDAWPSIVAGWRSLWKHLGQWIGVGVSLMFAGFLYSVALLVVMAPLMCVFMLRIIPMMTPNGIAPSAIPEFYGFNLLFFALMGPFEAYQSVVVTFAYDRLSRLERSTQASVPQVSPTR